MIKDDLRENVPEPEKRPAGDGWVWQRFRFMGVQVWGWKKKVDQGSVAER